MKGHKIWAAKSTVSPKGIPNQCPQVKFDKILFAPEILAYFRD